MHKTSPPPPPPLPAGPPVAPSGLAPHFPYVLMFIVWLAIVVTATLVTVIMPESFAGTVRIKVEPDRADSHEVTTNLYDPHFIPTQLEIIKSETILGRVINVLNLNEVWGRKYLDGGKLKTQESLALLQARVEVRQVPKTTLLEIRAYSENPKEAADLANSIADAYSQWRLETMKAGIKRMEEEQARELDERIRRVQLDLAALAGRSENAEKPSYLQKQKELEEVTELRRSLKLNSGPLNYPGPVMVLQRAVPSIKATRPNKPLYMILGFVFGGVASFSLAMLVYVSRHSTHKPTPGHVESPGPPAGVR